mmetsp:Transcript_39834/g.125135  ORF Transcript_39834/g.125135 Transcript_39834/m.125135 type:complete len:234 (+) Transcript_39834:575-1276(+)
MHVVLNHQSSVLFAQLTDLLSKRKPLNSHHTQSSSRILQQVLASCSLTLRRSFLQVRNDSKTTYPSNYLISRGSESDAIRRTFGLQCLPLEFGLEILLPQLGALQLHLQHLHLRQSTSELRELRARRLQLSLGLVQTLLPVVARSRRGLQLVVHLVPLGLQLLHVLCHRRCGLLRLVERLLELIDLHQVQRADKGSSRSAYLDLELSHLIAHCLCLLTPDLRFRHNLGRVRGY